MTTSGTRHQTRGFSLLEVLISIVIMSVGLLALATLQINIVRSSAEAKTQTIASNLALATMEGLISYRSVDRTTNNCTTETSDGDATTDSYQCIADGNDWVSESGGVYTTSSSSGSYVRTWTVDRCTGLTGNFTCGAGDTDDFALGTPRNEFKAVQVNVTWTDAAGNPQTVAVTDAVGSLRPSDAALISKKPIKLVPRYARENIYNPGSEAGVIPIAVGSGSSSAATNPKPEVIVGNAVVETRFDVLTYAGLIGDATVLAQARVETSMVGCTCDFATSPGASSTIRGNRPANWDGNRYVVPETASAAPLAGEAASQTQSSKCSICCRDHHDPAGATGATFSPLRVSHPTVSTAHPHYYTADGTSWTATSTGPYQEACRLIRVDGIFRVAPDLNNDYYALLATGDGTSANTSVPDTTSIDGTPPVTGAVGRYQKFVIGYLTGRFTTPPSSATQSDYNTVGAVNTSADPYILSATALYVLDKPDLVEIPLTLLTGKWLHSRGLYIDYLEADAVASINAAKDDSACNATQELLSACILKLLPFTTVNLTELGDWVTGDATRLAVTNFDFSTSIGVADPVRGKVTSSALTAATPVNITTAARLANTGLLDLAFTSISAVDNTKKDDVQPFNVTGSSGASTEHITVNLVLPNPYATGATPGLPVNTPNTPAVNHLLQSAPGITAPCGTPTSSPDNNTRVGGVDYRRFSSDCAIQGGYLAGLGLANGLAIEVLKYNFQYPSTQSSNITGCTYSGINPNNNATLAASTKTYNPPGPYNVNRCYNFALSSVAISPAGATTNSPGTVANTVVKAESTTVNFSNILANDVITMTFNGNPTFTTTLPSCTFTCTLNGGQTACATGASASTSFIVGSTPAACP